MVAMDEAFDPYRKWLGIPPAEQPPHHYRLLGLALFESDPDVIANAADARMAHVKTFQTGRYGELSQQVLNHLAGAKVCLLRPETKAEYDRQLQSELAVGPRTPPLPPAVPSPPPSELAPEAFGPQIAVGRRPRLKPTYTKRRRRHPWLIVTSLILLIAMLGVALVVVLMHSP